MSGRNRIEPSLAVGIALLAGSASAGQVSFGTLSGFTPGDGFGTHVKYADVDGDGDQDIAVAALSPSSSDGILYVFDDATSAPMATVFGFPGSGFGYALDVGNLNSSPGAEIVVGSPLASSNGRVSVYTWVTGGGGALIPAYPDVTAASIGAQLGFPHLSQNLGWSVVVTGDVNGDSAPDFVVSAPGGPMGQITAISGPSGIAIGASLDQDLGNALASLGDINADGFDDIAVGYNAGLIQIRFGNSQPSLLFLDTYYGGVGDPGLETRIAPMGDMNGDGIIDYAIGRPNKNSSTGEVDLYLSDAAALGTSPHLYNPDPKYTRAGAAAGAKFGMGLANAGDVDNDNVNDILVGAPGGAGYVEVISGTTGARMFRFNGQAGDNAGWSVAGVGDQNGDGFDDVMIGSTQVTASGAGQVELISFIDSSLPIVAYPDYISVSKGGTHTIKTNAGAAHQGKIYFVYGSWTGTNPSHCYGLIFDTYTNILSNPPPTLFTGFNGTLDSSGKATSLLTIPVGYDQLQPTTAAALLTKTLLHRPVTYEGTFCTAAFMGNVTTLRFDP